MLVVLSRPTDGTAKHVQLSLVVKARVVFFINISYKLPLIIYGGNIEENAGLWKETQFEGPKFQPRHNSANGNDAATPEPRAREYRFHSGHEHQSNVIARRDRRSRDKLDPCPK